MMSLVITKLLAATSIEACKPFDIENMNHTLREGMGEAIIIMSDGTARDPMIDFCPDGYVPMLKAIATAAQHWFAQQFTALEDAKPSQEEMKPESPIEKAVRIFSEPPVPHEWRQPFEEIAIQTVQRLRDVLHQGRLHAYYFLANGRHTISRDFWATGEADGVIESGIYWPFGRSSHVYEQRPNHRLFFSRSELTKLLSDQPAKKRPFPGSRIPDLVAALRKLEDLPRSAQYQALCELPEFREFKITHAIFREATRQLPRDPGRKSRRNS